MQQQQRVRVTDACMLESDFKEGTTTTIVALSESSLCLHFGVRFRRESVIAMAASVAWAAFSAVRTGLKAKKRHNQSSYVYSFDFGLIFFHLYMFYYNLSAFNENTYCYSAHNNIACAATTYVVIELPKLLKCRQKLCPAAKEACAFAYITGYFAKPLQH